MKIYGLIGPGVFRHYFGYAGVLLFLTARSRQAAVKNTEAGEHSVRVAVNPPGFRFFFKWQNKPDRNPVREERKKGFPFRPLSAFPWYY